MFNIDASIQQRLMTEFEKVMAEIIANYELKNMRASGNLPKSLSVENQDNKVILFGDKYVEQLEYGRKPGAVSKEGMLKLYQWILDKGLMDRSYKEYQIRGLAFVIARKLKEKGYDRAAHGGVGLVSEVLTDSRIKSIIDLVGQDLLPIFTAEILTFFKGDFKQ